MRQFKTQICVVFVTAPQLHSTNPELRFCAGSNPARRVSEIRDGEDLWQWFRLEIRLHTFRLSTIPQKQFIIIIIHEGITECIFTLKYIRDMIITQGLHFPGAIKIVTTTIHYCYYLMAYGKWRPIVLTQHFIFLRKYLNPFVPCTPLSG